MKKHQGFTLLEILVVLVIMTLILVIVPPFLPNVISGAHVKAAARELAASLKHARSLAIDRQSETTLIVNVEEKIYVLIDDMQLSKTKKEDYKNLTLPDEASLSLITAESEKLSKSEGKIRFFPDGSSTGGQIKLLYQDRSYRVDVHWLTGRIKITP